MTQEEFLKMFRDPVFVSLDEKKEHPPRHKSELRDVIELNNYGRWGAYFTVNGFANFPRNRHRKIEFVTSLNAHFVEIDNPDKPVRDIKNEAALLAAEKGIPFTAMVETGRGVHGYWILKEPIINPTDDQKREYERIQDALTQAFDGDKAARDIARILRIPFGKYWKDGSGKEMKLGNVTDNRYSESDFAGLLPQHDIIGHKKTFLPMEEVLYAKQGERHLKSFRLALKICNQFGDLGSRDIAHTMYRAVIDKNFEIGDNFHAAGGEADKQFESAWGRVRANPRIPHTEPQEGRAFRPAFSLDELMTREFPAAQWAVEKLFESGTINMISAPPNHYKSWVILEIALATAKGSMLWGTFETTKQLVMVVNEEDSERLIQNRMKMLADEFVGLPIFFHVLEGIKLTDAYVTKLLAEAESKGITMIIFDSLRSVHDKEENSSQEMQSVIDQLKKFTQKGLTVIFTHHNRKKPPFGGNKNDGEETRGSSAINAAVHGHLSLYAQSEKGETFIVARQQKLKADEKINPFELLVSSSPWGFIYRPHKDEEREESKVTERVTDALGAEDTWLSVEDLVSLGVGGTSTVRSALRDLVSQGYA